MQGAENTFVRGSKLVVTTHAATRWASRVRGDDHLPRRAAEADLMRCAQVAEVRSTAPSWLLVEEEFNDSRYLMLGDDVAIVVVPVGRSSASWAATTVVTRTDAGSVASAQRRTARHQRMMQERERSSRRIRGAGRRDDVTPVGDLDDLRAGGDLDD